MTLPADLEALRNQPGIDLPTMRRVDSVLSRYKGQRVTIKKGSGRADRIRQAQALASACNARPAAIRAIAAGLGVSVATAYRYTREIKQG